MSDTQLAEPGSSAHPAADTRLDLPARVAVRQIALEFLDAADGAYPRLADDGDAEALHDFRVALRRLRSTFRAYGTELRDTVSDKLGRRLTKLARATGPSRDLEVQVAWLVGARAKADELAHPGIDLVTAKLARARTRADRRMMRQLRKRWPALQQSLRSALAVYTASVPGHGETDSPFAATVAARAGRLGERLAERLARVHEANDDEAGHAARIAGKRARYLLEPIVDELEAARDAIRELKAIQDAFGDFHDAHVLESLLADMRESPAADATDGADPHVGLAFLQLRARAARDSAFGAAREWLGAGATRTAVALDRVVAELAEVAAHGVEIERKYLLTICPDEAASAPFHDISQGYLPGSTLIERVRRSRDAEGNVRYTRTVKSGRGVSRLEAEEACDASLFDALWPLTEGRRVEKRRHVVAVGPARWEVDVFTDRDLVLAEIELPAVEATVDRPAWLDAVMVREVTGDDDFANVNLAR